MLTWRVIAQKQKPAVHLPKSCRFQLLDTKICVWKKTLSSPVLSLSPLCTSLAIHHHTQRSTRQPVKQTASVTKIWSLLVTICTFKESLGGQKLKNNLEKLFLQSRLVRSDRLHHLKEVDMLTALEWRGKPAGRLTVRLGERLSFYGNNHMPLASVTYAAISGDWQDIGELDWSW